MYSESDIESAVEAQVLPRATAEAFRAHVAMLRQAPAVDEEQFRLITGFNDIFVSIATVMMLVALSWIGGTVASALGAALVAVAAWGLAEFFTLKRRMALPSIILLLAFSGGIFTTLISLLSSGFADPPEELAVAGAALITALATYVHWRRFHVPITVAAGTVALCATVLALIASALPRDMQADVVIMPLIMGLGVITFLFAMWWDMSDPRRETRRSDVAFWLHLAAAPAIAHPLFWLIGVTRGDDIGAAGAMAVLAVYILFAIVALAVDRRALLVSALAYVLYAMGQILREFGVGELNLGITALVIGSALLTLSAFWAPIRSALVMRLPDDLRSRLPVTHLIARPLATG